MSFHILSNCLRSSPVSCIADILLCLFVYLTASTVGHCQAGRPPPSKSTLHLFFSPCGRSLNSAAAWIKLSGTKKGHLSLWAWRENVSSVDSGEPAAWTLYNKSTQLRLQTEGWKWANKSVPERRWDTVGLNRQLDFFTMAKQQG